MANEGEGDGAQFTRETWRPGKRRGSYPRVRAWGGRKEAPAAFLAMARSVGLASMTAKRCARCGTQPAMRGSTLCRMHGGAGHASRYRGDYIAATYEPWPWRRKRPACEPVEPDAPV